MQVIITGKRGSQKTGGYINAELNDPQHPSREFVKQAKINLGAHRISISIEDQPDQPPIWQG